MTVSQVNSAYAGQEMNTGQNATMLRGCEVRTAILFISLVDKRVGGSLVNQCDLSLARAIPERRRDESLVTKRMYRYS